MTSLCKTGLLIPNAYALWKAALHLVLSDSRAKYRMTINLWPVNGATRQDAWPMPNIKS